MKTSPCEADCPQQPALPPRIPSLEVKISGVDRAKEGRQRLKPGPGGVVLVGARCDAGAADIGHSWEGGGVGGHRSQPWAESTPPRSPLTRVRVSDPRAGQLLVVPDRESELFWIQPAVAPTFIVLGDRTYTRPAVTLAIGDQFLLGTVGLTVLETHDGAQHRVRSCRLYEIDPPPSFARTPGLYLPHAAVWLRLLLFSAALLSPHSNCECPCFPPFLQVLSEAEVRHACDGDALPPAIPFRGEAPTAHATDDSDFTAAFGRDDCGVAPSGGAVTIVASAPNGAAADTAGDGDARQCYMCFGGRTAAGEEEEGGEEAAGNPLVAPCACRGDTRWVHLRCLRRWHSGGAAGGKSCVVAPAAS
ncbi:unnamed protein product, partial [Phaeothamnion confervicola]